MMGPGNKRDNPDQPCGMERGKNGQEQEAELERYWGILTPNSTMGGIVLFHILSNSQDNTAGYWLRTPYNLTQF